MSESPFGSRAQALISSDAGKEEAINPANSQEQKMAAAAVSRTRIPMSAPRAKLTTPPLPGYHTHWLNDYPGRIMQASAGGYEFVSPAEALVTMPDLAGSQLGTGTDLGSRVSIVVGKNEDGSPLRAYLMKIRDEFYKEDQAASLARVDQIEASMREGRQGSALSVDDARNRYVKTAQFKSVNSRSA